ncbi:MAG: hypothetical protein K2X47_01845, partial [Bdellovibrionales bacterium]|nr:hypothetical protein [Bdellovibrionales bacterium]
MRKSILSLVALVAFSGSILFAYSNCGQMKPGSDPLLVSTQNSSSGMLTALNVEGELSTTAITSASFNAAESA